MNKIEQASLRHQMRILSTNISTLQTEFADKTKTIYTSFTSMKNVTPLEDTIYRNQLMEELNKLTRFIGINLKKVLVPEQRVSELVEMVREHWYLPGIAFNSLATCDTYTLYRYLLQYSATINTYLHGLQHAIEHNEIEFALMQYANMHFLQIFPKKRSIAEICATAREALQQA